MKKKTLFLSRVLLTALILILSAFSLSAFGVDGYLEYGKFLYTVENGEVTVLYTGTELYESVTIPSEIDGYPVTTIGFGAFMNAQPSEVIIPEGIVTIEELAFSGCYFVPSFTLPSTVKYIGNSAFNFCTQLGEVNLPEGLETIGERAFSMCDALEEIVIPDSVTVIGRNAFYECFALKSVTLPKELKVIDKFTFCGCDLRSITIPDTVEKIKKKAFYDCDNLTSVTVPESVTSIGKYAFSASDGMKEIYILNPECKFYKGAVGSNTTIYGYKNSTAYDYATANGRTFVDIETVETTAPTTEAAELSTTEPVSTEPTTTASSETTTEPTQATSSTEPVTQAPAEPSTEPSTKPVKVRKPAKVKIKSAKAKGRKATVKWAVVKTAKGYEIEYSTAKKFRKKATKVKVIKKAKTNKATIKNLHKGKKYFIRIRAYKSVNGQKLYGVYSKTKSVKIK